MHESAVAHDIVNSILAEAKNQPGKVTRVLVSCGQINALNDEVMQFAFEAATADTICQGAKLEIKHIPLKATCKNCSGEFEFDLYNPNCPKCGKSDCTLGEDAPLLLEEIEFEED
ncbi:MAG: hydrogenase maturation nickel metallochaperone HypA [Sedimentisphaerales bacterium]|nr:hydrogenase maturation nickel metallochaperone HypA [Sedimentisphaerales bacterium]